MQYIVIFHVIIVILGGYLIYSALQMKKTGEINPVMVNREEMRDCTDPKDFIAGIYVPTLVFGGISSIFGILGCINDVLFHFGRIYEVGGVLVFLASWLWFSRELRRRKANFF